MNLLCILAPVRARPGKSRSTPLRVENASSMRARSQATRQNKTITAGVWRQRKPWPAGMDRKPACSTWTPPAHTTRDGMRLLFVCENQTGSLSEPGHNARGGSRHSIGSLSSHIANLSPTLGACRNTESGCVAYPAYRLLKHTKTYSTLGISHKSRRLTPVHHF